MEQNLNRRLPLLLPALLLVGAAAMVGCSTMKAPGIQVDKIRVESIRLTGASLEIGFRVRNQAPELLAIERFEYQLKLNGEKVGSGYFADAVQIRGFDETKITTRFDLNFLHMPASVKAILDSREVDADVSGTFYVRRGSSTGKLRVSHHQRVPLARDRNGS